MATKSKPGTVRLPSGYFGYVTTEGKLLDGLVLPDNMPKLSGTRTGNDRNFLKSNDGKLSKLQQIIA